MQKKKLPYFILACIPCLLIGIWAIGRLTGVIQFYTIPTPGNEPTIKTGAFVIASNLRKPKRFDFIAYKELNGNGINEIYMKRLCGIEGDIIEIKEGVLYVNGQNVDNNLNLKHIYKTSFNSLELLKISAKADIKPEGIIPLSNDSVFVYLEDKYAIADKKNFRLMTQPIGTPEVLVQKAFKEDWNIDNFGPVEVPNGHYFLLGDNRHNSMDSRMNGFTPVEKFIGTLLF